MSDSVDDLVSDELDDLLESLHLDSLLSGKSVEADVSDTATSLSSGYDASGTESEVHELGSDRVLLSILHHKAHVVLQIHGLRVAKKRSEELDGAHLV